MSKNHTRRWSVRFALIGAVTTAALGILALAGAPTEAGATAATTEPSPYAGKIGINSHAIWLGADDATAMFNQLMAAGITSTREDLSWAHAEPSPGQWDWSRGDNMFTAASRSGIDILGILDYSANWAAAVPGNDQSMPAPSHYADFANFGREVVRRYGSGGTFWAQHPELRPQPLREVEVFNEPWGYWGWPGEPDPAAYARLARVTAQAVRATNPNVKILICGDLLQARHNGQDIHGWIDEMLDADPGLPSLVDGYSIHPYHLGGPEDVRADQRWDYGKVALIRRITAAHNANLPMWITEVGWATASNVEGHVSEATQATYVRQAIERAFTDWPYVQRFYLYSYDKDNGNPNDAASSMGIRHTDGTPKRAFTTLTDMLAPRTVTTSTTTPPTTTPPTTTPPITTPPTTTPPQSQQAVVGPALLAVRVLGRVFYYDPAGA